MKEYRFCISGSAWEYGKRISRYNEWIESDFYAVTRLLPVTEGHSLAFSHLAFDGGAFYDEDGEWLTGFGNASATPVKGTVEVPEKAYYIRINATVDILNANTLSVVDEDTGTELVKRRYVAPIYKDDLGLDYEKEGDAQYFRAKLNGELTFIGGDYDWLAAQPFDTEFFVSIERSRDNGRTWGTAFFTGSFFKTDCEWSADDRTCTVKPGTVDAYTELEDNLETEYDIVKLGAEISPCTLVKRPAWQAYVLTGDTVFTYSNAGYTEDDADAQSDPWEIMMTDNAVMLPTFRHFEVDITPKNNYSGELDAYAARYYGDANQTLIANELAARECTLTLKRYDGKPGTLRITWQTLIHVENPATMATIVLLDGDGGEYMTGTVTSNEGWYFNAPVNMYGPILEESRDYAVAELLCDTVFARMLLDRPSYLGTAAYPFNRDADFAAGTTNYGYVVPAELPIVASYEILNTPTRYGAVPGSLDKKYYAPPDNDKGRRYLPVSPAMWPDNCSYWLDTLQMGYSESAAWSPYRLKDAYPLSAVISTLLRKAAPGLTHKDAPEYSEYLYGADSSFRLFVTPKSNLLKSDYTQAAQKGVLTLKSVFDMLAQCFKLHYFVDSENRLRIEPVAFFRNGLSEEAPGVGADLTAMKSPRSGKPLSFATSSWTFNKDDMPKRYTFEWMDEVSDVFEGDEVVSLSRYVDASKTEDITVADFTSDVDYMLVHADDMSEDGFALLAVETELTYPQFSPYSVNPNTGELAISDDRVITDQNAGTPFGSKLMVSAGNTYILSHTHPGAWYDAEGKFISGYSTDTGERGAVTAPEGAMYLTASFLRDEDKSVQAAAPQVLFGSVDFDGATLYLQNYMLSFAWLAKQFYVQDAPASLLRINGETVEAESVARHKEQTVNYPSADDPDPLKLVRTEIGDGHAEKLTLTLSSRNVKATLRYDTEQQP